MRRQCDWLAPSWTWLLKEKVLPTFGWAGARPTALDVGCGPGLVMEHLAHLFEVRGVDMEREEVQKCSAKGLDTIMARAEELPFEDGSFDVVYCSYLLMWVDDPETVVHEMARVAKGWVVCLAEPDHLGKISYPPDMKTLDEALIEGLRRSGADPMMGRKLPGLLTRCGLSTEAGIYAGSWTSGRMKEESEGEWGEISHMIDDGLSDDELNALRGTWDRATRDGSLVQHNPVFYAMARKDP